VGLRPEFRLLANGGDITATVQARLKALRFTDATGLESDVLDVALDDSDPANQIQMPPTGAELELFLGYDGQAQRMGLFVVDEVDLMGWPGDMRIRAHAAPFDKSKGGKNTLQSQKTRSWPKDTKLGAMVQKIAKEHGMEGAVSQSLASITLPHLDQSDESDMHFLVRIARKYDAVVKPAGGKLVVAKRGETKSVSGQQLPAVSLTPADVATFRVTLSKRETSGSVVAAWHETKKAKRHTVTVGSGEPVTRLRQQYANEAMAKAAATAELDKRARQQRKLNVTLAGRADLAAEAPLTMAGFRDGVDGEWIITSVDHSLDNGGYICTIQAEVPNADGQKNVQQAQD
jgi:phage protein D